MRSVVLITGAGSGMGRSHALTLAEKGASVAYVDRDAPAAATAAAESGDRALAIQADVTDLPGVRAAVDQVVDRYGRLDAVVANAGITVGGARETWEMSEADWDSIIDVNLTGVWKTIAASIPALTAAGSGVILAVSSVAGLSGSPRWGAYAAPKHGVIGLVRTLANELAPRGIRCNAICPGMVATPMLHADAQSLGLSDEDAHREFVAGHLFPRLIEAREISEVVAFLVSPASSAITGQAVPADLGFLARTPGTAVEWGD